MTNIVTSAEHPGRGLAAAANRHMTRRYSGLSKKLPRRRTNTTIPQTVEAAAIGISAFLLSLTSMR